MRDKTLDVFLNHDAIAVNIYMLEHLLDYDRSCHLPVLEKHELIREYFAKIEKEYAEARKKLQEVKNEG